MKKPTPNESDSAAHPATHDQLTDESESNKFDLQQQLQNYARYLDLSEIILVALDAHARVTMLGGSGYKVLGYQPGEIIGKNWFELCLPPEHCAAVYTVYQQLMRGEQALAERFENQILTKTGQLRTIAWHNDILRDPAGGIIGTLSSGIDITDYVNAVAALQISEAHFRNIIDTSPVPYALNDANQNITYLNPAFTRTFGYDLRDIPTLADWWPKAYPDTAYRQQVITTWQHRFEQAIVENKPFEPMELTIRCKDGTERSVLASAALLNESLTDTHLVILFDITELKQAEQARKDSESRYRLIVETAQEGIWTIDADNNTSFVNRKMAEILGYRVEEMLGRSMFDFMDEEGRQIAHRNVERRKAGIAEQHEFRFINKKGEAVWAELQTSPLLDDQGEYTGALAMVTDITDRYLADAALRASESKYRTLFENMTTGFALHEIICDEAGAPCNYRYLEVNPAFERLTGAAPSQLLGKTILDVMPDTETYWIEVFGRVALTGEPLAYQNYSRELGRTYDTWVFSPQANQFAVIFTDITERKQTEDELATLAERLNLATTAGRLGIWDWDLTQNQMNWDERMFELYGVSRGSFQPDYTSWTGTLHPDDRAEIEVRVRDALYKNKPYDCEFRIFWPDGTLRHLKADGQVIRDEAGRPLRMIGVNYDITESKQVQAKLHFMAHHDVLTELPNRILFMDRLNRALSRAKRHGGITAVFYMDLDRFKNINDTFGHETGDKFLLEIARCLQPQLRSSDTIARLGGDEFALIVEEIHNTEEVMMVADKILDELNKPYVIDKHEFYVTTSIGISLFPNDASDANTLLKNADTAMYRAKELGRNNYQFYSKDLSIRAMERLTLENELRRAIDNNEFVLYYQPQIDIKTGRVLAIEALIRWQHPELGLVAPAKFIALAEETGLILPIGRSVLTLACQQLSNWLAQGLSVVPVSVNISGRQFIDGTITGFIKQQLVNCGLPPTLLELEITEGAMMQNPLNASAILEELNNIGIRIAIDDFGTGYSSLAYLKRYPITTLKIDRSFVRDLSSDPNDASIVLAIIAMAHSMGMRVIAEGVETAAQLDFLRAHACDSVQGYLFSHPVPAQEMQQYLAKNRNGLL